MYSQCDDKPSIHRKCNRINDLLNNVITLSETYKTWFVVTNFFPTSLVNLTVFQLFKTIHWFFKLTKGPLKLPIRG